jgi:allophanate hydrolase
MMSGPKLRVLAESVRVALVGCTGTIDVGEGDTKRVPSGRTVRVNRGDVFRVTASGDSVCAYLAIEGGLNIPAVLGSAATNARSGIGGFCGRRLQQGDMLPVNLNSALLPHNYTLARPLDLALDQSIRVVLGPQADYFTEDALETFLSSEYSVSLHSDRMGYRLEGPPLTHARGYNIVSDGIVTGAIQVPGSGQPIVLMVDNPTTGGYPKVATVISSDVPVLARRGPGRKLRFAAVDVNQAQAARRQLELSISQQVNTIRPVR